MALALGKKTLHRNKNASLFFPRAVHLRQTHRKKNFFVFQTVLLHERQILL